MTVHAAIRGCPELKPGPMVNGRVVDMKHTPYASAASSFMIHGQRGVMMDGVMAATAAALHLCDEFRSEAKTTSRQVREVETTSAEAPAVQHIDWEFSNDGPYMYAYK